MNNNSSVSNFFNIAQSGPWYASPSITAGAAILVGLIAFVSVWASDRRKKRADFRGKSLEPIREIHREVIEGMDPFERSRWLGSGDHRHLAQLRPSMAVSIQNLEKNASALTLISKRCKKQVERMLVVYREVDDAALEGMPMSGQQSKRLQIAKDRFEKHARRYMLAG